MGPLFGGIADVGMGFANQNFAQGQMQQQENFQEQMSSTSWQRGVKDMEAAGINPILAASKGGASSPSGSMASPQLPTDVGSSISNAVSSSMQASRLASDLASQQVQRDKTRAETANVNATNPLIVAQTMKTNQDTTRSAQETNIRAPEATMADIANSVYSNSAYRLEKQAQIAADPALTTAERLAGAILPWKNASARAAQSAQDHLFREKQSNRGSFSERFDGEGNTIGSTMTTPTGAW